MISAPRRIAELAYCFFRNPPFVGGKLMRTRLNSDYVDVLFKAYADLVPAEADLVTYWFARAWEVIKAGRHKRGVPVR